jgi:hypothetical protein
LQDGTLQFSQFALGDLSDDAGWDGFLLFLFGVGVLEGPKLSL